MTTEFGVATLRILLLIMTTLPRRLALSVLVFLVWTLVTSGWLVMRTHAKAAPKAAAAAV